MVRKRKLCFVGSPPEAEALASASSTHRSVDGQQHPGIVYPKTNFSPTHFYCRPSSRLWSQVPNPTWLVGTVLMLWRATSLQPMAWLLLLLLLLQARHGCLRCAVRRMVLYSSKCIHSLACQHRIVSARRLILHTEQIFLIM